MKKFNWFDWLCLTLVIIGALNWGLVGFFEFNLVSFIFRSEIAERLIYAIVGLCFIPIRKHYPFFALIRAELNSQSGLLAGCNYLKI